MVWFEPKTDQYMVNYNLNWNIMHLMQHNSKSELPTNNEATLPEMKTIPTENGHSVDKDVMVEVVGPVGVYDQWVAPSVSGTHPKPRYEVLLLLKFIDSFFLFYLFLIIIIIVLN